MINTGVAGSSNGTETWDLPTSDTAVRGGVTQDLGEVCLAERSQET